jgi:SPP1 gp7 family putative phage head morphogenesis protein
MKVILDPIIPPDSFEEDLEAEITRWFAQVVYGPLFGMLPIERENATGDYSALIEAIKSGRVQYSDGVFTGKFSATISKSIRSFGGRFEPSAKIFKVNPDEIPYALRGSLAEAREAAREITDGVINLAAQISEHVVESPLLGLPLSEFTTKLLSNLEKQFRHNLLAAAHSQPALDFVTVPPDFTPAMVEDVREELTTNINLSIKNFTEQQMLEVRKLAEENWELGGRVDRLREILEERFGIAGRKSKFLAKQETSLVASHYARARAEDIGSTEYVWQTRHDDKVRPEHEARNGKSFSWDNPPFDTDIQEHVNPGEAFGCRCVARAMLNIRAKLNAAA